MTKDVQHIFWDVFMRFFLLLLFFNEEKYFFISFILGDGGNFPVFT